MPSCLQRPPSSLRSGRAQREPLAVIGIGCRLPGGINSPSSLWEALLKRVDAIRDVPDDRWHHDRFHDTDPEKSGCIRNAKGGFIDGVDQFDGEFFGYYPAAAQRIDPQQRLLLEVTHEAMEDAGLRRDQFDGSRTAVFVGSFMYDYLCIQAASEQRDEISPQVAMGTAVCSLANRISYDFNLKGPSVSLDTACSSSLTALHLACQSVWNGEAEMAVAGGVSLMLRPESSIMLSKGGFLNPDQACKAFDETANGYVRGEGAGIVVLKPLDRALADGDAIYACVKATAVNQDGYLPEGFTVPNVVSQIELLQDVYRQAEIDPRSVHYVEAHGTGTPVGDPVETAALGSVLGFERDPQQSDLLIGSVKTNLGHLEGASGVAGFIKGVLAAQHRLAPPSLHFQEPNPAIPWEHYRLQVPTEPKILTCKDRPSIVGVNSFGAGGANAHAVLQSFAGEEVAATSPESREQDHGPLLYTLSAANRQALQSLAQRHAEFLGCTQQPLTDVAYSAFNRRSRYRQLLAIVGNSGADLQRRLRQFADGQVDPGALSMAVNRQHQPKLAFVFSGQGGQWPRMGMQLMHDEPVFRAALEEIDAHYQERSGGSLIDQLRKDHTVSRIDDTLVVQPAVMAIQIALLKLYEHYGIKPHAVVGHSIGEVAAAVAAGALDLEQAAEVIYHRSRGQSLAAGKGGMLAVGLSFDEARQLLDSYPGVSIGAVNGPEMLTLSGDVAPLKQIADLLDSQSRFQRAVRVDVAYHSHHMEPIRGRMLDALSTTQGRQASMPLYSTVTARRESGEHLNAEYWYRNVREPVLFTEAFAAMIKDGFDTFIEIGPHPVLVRGGQALIEQRGTDGLMAPSMNRKQPESTVFLQSLALLAARGIEPDAESLFGQGRRYVRLPKYPWQHSRYWFESPQAGNNRRGAYSHPFLKRQTEFASEPGLAVWEAAIGAHKFPYLRDHQVDGEIVFPAAGHIELAWAAASEQYPHESFFLEDLHFDLPLILPEGNHQPLDVRLEIVSDEGDYKICSRPTSSDGATHWTRHSLGRINKLLQAAEPASVSLTELKSRFEGADEVAIAEFYDTIQAAGLAYGSTFQCVESMRQAENEILAQLNISERLEFEARRNSFHPALLDACIHVLFADVHRRGDPSRIFLPYSVDRVRFLRQATGALWSYVRVTRNDDEYLNSDTLVFNDAGDLVAEVRGLVCKRLVGAGSHQTDTSYEGCYEYRWNVAPHQPAIHRRVLDFRQAILIGDESELSSELTRSFASEGIASFRISHHQCMGDEDQIPEIPLDRRTLIVFLGGEIDRTDRWQGLSDQRQVPALLQLAKILHQRQGVSTLGIVTRSAAGVADDQRLVLGDAILHGMARVIRNECPQAPLKLIDVPRQPTRREFENLYRELLHARLDLDETEIALRGGERFVRQLVSIDRETAERNATSEQPGVGGDYHAERSASGSLDDIRFRRRGNCNLGAEEVEIAVTAAALNFKDVVNAMGLLPEKAVAGGLTAGSLGLEVSGRVLRAGDSVQHVSVGDDVIARVPEGFCGRVVTNGRHVFRRPSRLTSAQAAAIPVVYLTAWYSLHHLARLAPGERVLIHSAAGGVGTAAIALAHRAGATVIATAGTKEKRDYLRQLGVEHVFDSRSLDFADGVMKATGGRGVDVVLNSLTGRFVTESVRCLAPFGRFVELGKTDVYNNHKLGLENLGDNVSYFVVDVDRLAQQKPDLHRQMLANILALFDRGDLQPSEITEFPISKLSEAFRFMTRANYRGKIVMKMHGDQVPTSPERHARFRSDRSYLITGGAGGFGLEIARWMVERGARRLVLVSRSGCKTEYDQAAVRAMQAQGAVIEDAQVDISDLAALRLCIAGIQASPEPLAGVIHGAAVMDDASISAMTMDRFEPVFDPKAGGAWNLHQATCDSAAELDFFLMLSSISSVLGFVGQLNYVAANYFQDALAQFRRQAGLPATAINLGVLGTYAGLSRAVNENQDVIELLESQGMSAMRLDEILDKLQAVLIQQPAHRLTARIDWSRFRTAYPHLARDSRFINVMSDEAMSRNSRPKSAGLRGELAELDAEQRTLRLRRELAGSLARILDADPDKLDHSTSIDNLGLDSLMLTELQIWIGRALDITLPLIKLLKGPSIVTLASELLAELDGVDSDGQTTEPTAQGTVPFTLADLDGVRVLSPWLIRGSSEPDAPCRLVCFHSMGVGASLFTNFLVNPLDGFDTLAVQTPGRENRIAEPLLKTVDELVDHIVPQLQPLFDRPVVFWGHSFGGIVGVEVIRRLRDDHQLQPAHVLVSGTMAPHLIRLWQHRGDILKATVADNSPEYLMSLARYVDDPEFLKMVLPMMRHDWPLLGSYRYRDLGRLDCPITALAARQDDIVYTDEVEQWSQYTNGSFDLIEVDGDHWFLNRNQQRITGILSEIGSDCQQRHHTVFESEFALEAMSRPGER